MTSQNLAIGILLLFMSTLSSAASDEPWAVGQYEEDGKPVVMKVIENMPPQSVRKQFGWLTVITWQYDGSNNGGMPAAETNSKMMDLEQAIDRIQEEHLCLEVYSRTGNGIKELAYYIGSREKFMEAFNRELADHPPYPLAIEFFEDPEWSDLQIVHETYLQKKE